MAACTDCSEGVRRAVCVQSGELVRLYQDPTGRTPFLSEAHLHPDTGDLILGSFRNRFLGRVSRSALEAAANMQ